MQVGSFALGAILMLATVMMARGGFLGGSKALTRDPVFWRVVWNTVYFMVTIVPLQLRFGLVDGYCYTLEEVGKKFGVTRERIRQIEDNALKRLRNAMETY